MKLKPLNKELTNENKSVSTKHQISIVIPTYNEEENINSLILKLHSAFYRNNIKYELIFVDDNSSDDTRKEIRKFIDKKYPIRIFLKRGRKGKAFSLIEEFKKAKYDIVAMIDADLQYPPEVIIPMYKKLEKVDIVVLNLDNQKNESISHNKYILDIKKYKSNISLCIFKKKSINPQKLDFYLSNLIDSNLCKTKKIEFSIANYNYKLQNSNIKKYSLNSFKKNKESEKIINRKKVCVVIPTYNEKENIAKLLNNLLDVFKTIKNFEMSILVVDDNSPDGTGKVVKKYSAPPRTIFIC